ncbi:MAG: hypothetical protein JWL77_3219 [Chthonomonadaceae bacterium]|nr:hypothetical protein [Chthonomonadaceae bacterium]
MAERLTNPDRALNYLGTFLGLPAVRTDSGSSSFLGASSAGNSFNLALLKYGTGATYTYALDPGALQNAEVALGNWSHVLNGTKRIEPQPLAHIARILRQKDYTVFHNVSDFQLWLGAYARRRYSQHPFPVTSVAYTVSYARLASDFTRLLFADIQPYDSIICPTNACKVAVENQLNHVAQQYSQLAGRELRFGGRVSVIPYGVDTELYRERDQQECRRQLNLPTDGVIILCVGRFSVVNKMDLHPLFLAFRRMLAKALDTPVYLVLAGGDQENYSQALIEQASILGIRAKVIFWPNFSTSSRPMLYSAADVFVSPSDNIQESFGLALTEAMASGLPIVASDWNGYREIVHHGHTGYLVPTYWAPIPDISKLAPLTESNLDQLYAAQSLCIDVDDLTDHLYDLVSNQDKRIAMGKKAREYAVSYFDWKRVIRAYEALWLDLKAEALQRGWPVPEYSRSVFTPYYEAFAHYPTRMIDTTCMVALTDFGASIYRKHEALPLPNLMMTVIDPATVHAILRVARMARWLRYDLTIEEIGMRVTKKLYLTADDILRAVLWMLKQDMLELAVKSLPKTGMTFYERQ